MSDSMITKRALAASLKELVRRKSFEKISVADITGGCGLGRQAFYYHFQDKFELLNWIYYQEAFAELCEGITFENWPEHMYGLFRIMQEDAAFYRNTVGSQPEDFTEYLESVTSAAFSGSYRKAGRTEADSREEEGILRPVLCPRLQWYSAGMGEGRHETVRPGIG